MPKQKGIKNQTIIECPECGSHFDFKTDVINKMCKVCKQWMPSIDFGSGCTTCSSCRGKPPPRFSTQIRLRTKDGKLLKMCTKCKKWTPEDRFAKDSESGDGLQQWCTSCNSIYQQEKRTRIKNEQVTQ